MKRWIWLLVLSLAIGAGLAWIARPLEIHFRWGDRGGQSATLSVNESTARAERTVEEEKGIAGAQALSQAFSAIAREVSPSVVTIYSERTVVNSRSTRGQNPFGGLLPDDFFGPFFQLPDRQPMRGMGSGVIVESDGKVLTNNHVVAGADRVKVTLADGRSFDAKVVGRDPKSDVAVVEIDARDLPAVKLGDSDALEIGEWVLAIGNPFELTQTVTAGIVSAKGRSSVGLADYEDFIQTDAAINPGNSGGALVNLAGQVVGINTAIATRSGGYQGVGFAIPINMAAKVMDSLIRTGKVTRGYIGVTLQQLDPDLADNYGLDHPQGALVNSVTKGSPAEDAGLESGDLILQLDGKPIRDREDLRLRIGEMQPGTSVELTVMRNDSRKTIRVKLGEMPSDEELASGGGGADESEAPSFENLGLSIARIDREARQRYQIDPDIEGLLVINVEPGTPAADAGLREGDILVDAGREPVTTVAQLKDQIKKTPPGKTVLLKVRREDANVFLALRVPKS